MSSDNKLFSNVKYIVTGKIKKEVKTLLQCNGAEVLSYFSDCVTHCIVGENPDDMDVSLAVELYEIPVVTQEWATYSHKCNKLLPTSGFKGGCNQLFTGVVATFSKVTQGDKKKLWALLKFYGGTFSNVVKERNTHLIVTKAEGPMYQQALKSGTVCVVTPDWLVDSIKAGHLVDVEMYHPRLLLEDRPPISRTQTQVLLLKNIEQQLGAIPKETPFMQQQVVPIPKEIQIMQQLVPIPKETPFMQQQVVPIPKETPFMQQKVVPIPKETLIMQQVMPIPKETPIMQQQVVPIPKETLFTQQVVPISKETPSMQQQVVPIPKETLFNSQITKCLRNLNSTIPMQHERTAPKTALCNGGDKENIPNLSQSSGGSPWLGWDNLEGSPFKGWDNSDRSSWQGWNSVGGC